MRLGFLADHVCGKVTATADMRYGKLVGEKFLHQNCAACLSEVSASHQNKKEMCKTTAQQDLLRALQSFKAWRAPIKPARPSHSGPSIHGHEGEPARRIHEEDPGITRHDTQA